MRKARFNAAEAASSHEKKRLFFQKFFKDQGTKKVAHYLDKDPSQRSAKVRAEVEKEKKGYPRIFSRIFPP